MTRSSYSLGPVVTLLLVPVWGWAEPAAEDADFFERNVRPVLAENCFECHGPQEATQGLRLDSRAGMLRGGELGPALVPGKPAESLLIHAINHGEELQMPPERKLGAAEIAGLSEWIARGAPWPGSPPPELTEITLPDATPQEWSSEAQQFWAFQPLRKVALPPVDDPAWPRATLDYFILSQLESEGLRPAPPAARRTLIRRATFDLIGLPPTPTEVDSFLADERPGAFRRVVDRLLSSPHYGEHWARHWMDVIRYADSNGLDENLAFEHAYRYRDYLIRALNRDLPYDQFVREQIAGDLLPRLPAESEQTAIDRQIATGVYAVGSKMLADDDARKKELDCIDELIRTFGRGLLGMTLDCARCHDHKFDPISAADYYALAGIFKSTRLMKSFGSVDSVVAQWQLHTVATAAEQRRADEHAAALAAARAEVQERIRRANQALLVQARQRWRDYLAAAADFVRPSGPVVIDGQLPWGPVIDDLPHRGNHWILREAEHFHRGDIYVDHAKWGQGIGIVSKQSDQSFVEYDVQLPEAGSYQLELRYASQHPRSARLMLNGSLVREQAATQTTGGYDPAHQAWYAEGVFEFQAGRNTIRLEAIGPHLDKLLIIGGPRSRAAVAVDKTAHLRPVFLRQCVEFLRNQVRRPSTGWQSWLARARTGAEHVCPLPGQAPEPPTNGGVDAPPLLVDAERGPFRLPRDPQRFYPAAVRQRLEQDRGRVAKLAQAAPVLPVAMGVREGNATDLPVHRRGSYLTLGRTVPRGFPGIIAGRTARRLPTAASGRLELAEWLTRNDHPLTPRVIVNRVWRWHFGEGIVRTPNNFGRLGERPDHPQLLDQLTLSFLRSGWSLKALHREIMLSTTYRMSGAHNRRAAAMDPENRWLWRFPRQRLAAEQLRDALVACSGNLDRALYGSLFKFKDHTYVTVSEDRRGADMFTPNRRSIYLPVIRSALYEVLQAFDFPDPSITVGDRPTTTVATQALVMMNSELVSSYTQKLARSLLTRYDLDDPGRVRVAFQRTLSRAPTENETAEALAFLQQVESALQPAAGQDPSLAAWRSLCRVLVGSNEFIYLD